MSIYAQIGEEQTQFASNKGWGDLCRWIDTLDAGQFPEVAHLREHGWEQEIDSLKDQLSSALESSPPGDETVAATAQSLLSLLASDEPVFVTNGMGPDDDDKESEPSQFAEDAAADIAFIGSASASRRINATLVRLRQLLKQADLTRPGSLMGEIETAIIALRPAISADLSASMLGGTFQGMADGLTEVPFPLPLSTEPATAAPPSKPPAEPPKLADFFDEPEEPEMNFPAVQDAIDTLQASPAFAGADFRETAAQIKEGAFAITGELTDKAVADVRDLLAKHLEEGPDREKFGDEVETLLGKWTLSPNHIQTVFRTNVSAAQSDGKDRALNAPLVADAFPYRQYWATTDERTRKTHRALEHLGLDSTNVYRADDPTWKKFRPVWDFGCRCRWNPLSVEQAAREGVQEAKDWWARAKEMAAEQGDNPYEYLSRTAPQAPQWVQPPPFEPSPEFTRE